MPNIAITVQHEEVQSDFTAIMHVEAAHAGMHSRYGLRLQKLHVTTNSDKPLMCIITTCRHHATDVCLGLLLCGELDMGAAAPQQQRPPFA